MVFKGESPRPYDEEGQAGVQKRSRKPGEAPYVPTEEIPDIHPDANPEEALARAQEEYQRQREGLEQDKIAKMLEEKQVSESGQGATREYQPKPPQVDRSRGVKSEFVSPKKGIFYERESSPRGAQKPRYKTEPTHLRQKPNPEEQPTDLQ